MRYLVLAGVAFVIMACSGGGDAGVGVSEESVEYKLAAVDTGKPPSDNTVARYANTLDALEGKCTDSRIRLSDMAVVSKQETGRSALTIMQDVLKLIPSNAAPQACAEAFALVSSRGY